MGNNFDAPLSRVEALLQNTLGAENEVVPQSRIEELLERLDEELENGGGGRSNVDVIVADNKIQFLTKGGA